jgi:hypothetical protein
MDAIQGVDGLLWGKETELPSPGRGAVAIAPRRAARPDADDAAGLRRVARRPLPVNAAGTRHPNLEYPSFALKMRASASDILASLNKRLFLLHSSAR